MQHSKECIELQGDLSASFCFIDNIMLNETDYALRSCNVSRLGKLKTQVQ
jgi:hypothetical protein